VSARVSRLPSIQQNLDLSPAALGAALSAIWVGALAAMPLTSWVVHRVGGRAAVLVAVLAQCIALPPIGLARDALELVLAFAAFGIASGAMAVSMNAEGVAVEQRCGRPIMASLHGLFSLGAMVGAALGGLVAGQGIAPAPHFAGAALAFGSVAAIASRALPVVPDAAPTRGGLVFNQHIVALGVLAFCILVGEGAMADWTAIYLRSVVATSVAEAAAGYAVFSAFMAMGRLSGDPLCARLGPVWLVRAGALLGAAGLALAIAGGTKWAALTGFALVGAGYATIIPNTYSAAGRVPGVPRGTAIATVTMIGYFGFLIGPPVIGWTADRAGLRIALAIVPVLAVLAAALSRNLEPRHNM
jgi:MFS family permease